MGVISAKQYQQRLQSVAKITVLRELVNEELVKDEQTIKLLKEQDFLQGDIFGDGTKLRYRSLDYERFKQSKNPIAGGKVDLINTGAFVDAMYLLKPKQNRYQFGNKDSKRNILKEIYGDNIFGLNQKVFDKYQKEIIAPRFLIAIKRKANL
jgi:hypothetical protein